MSMKTPFPAEIPEETRRLVEPLLTEDSVYRLVGKDIGQILNDEDFKDMYAEEGRPAVNPVILGLVTVFQFMEGLPDRAAAEAAVMRLDWKYALRQELDWRGFHYSDLCNFRKRLVDHGRERQVFERVVGYLRRRGYIKGRGRQRTDAAHIVGHVERLSRLELVWETIRVALGAVISTDAPWVIERIPTGFVQTHTERRRDYRLTQDEVAEEMATAGQEGSWLVGQIEAHGTPELQGLPEVAQLKRVLNEQFTRGEDGKAAPRPPGQCKGDVLTSPHDPDVRYGAKGGKGWVGYKLQVTETADDVGHFITDVEIVPAMTQDNHCLKGIQERLAAQNIPPAKQYVDQAFMSGENIAASRKAGVDLRGYVREGNTRKPAGFRLGDFDIDIDQRQAICPAGKKQAKWASARAPSKSLIAYHVAFGPQCQTCQFFGPNLCTDQPKGRYLGISRYHDMIQERRREAATETFRVEMHIRAGIEGCISEMVRAHGLRRSRYRGVAKNQLQALFIATATNLKRLACAIPFSVFRMAPTCPC